MTDINFILCSRNDDYCGNPIERLKVSLAHNIEILKEYNGWQITVVDWASDVKIEDAIGIKHPNLQFLYVPKEITNKIKSKFSEVHALNYAARLSNSKFIGRLDQDTMIGKKFIAWFFNNNCKEEEFYFCRRSDLNKGVFDIDGESGPNAPLSFDPWVCAVGILLVPTKYWKDCTGYNEENIHFNHMEHEFIFRLKQKISFVDLTHVIGYDFFHIYHDRNVSDRVYNQLLGFHQLTALEYIANNVEDWGLNNF